MLHGKAYLDSRVTRPVIKERKRETILSKLSNMAHRDIETVLHPYTNLARHREVGPLILNEGRGIYLYDDKGKRYIEGLAGLVVHGAGLRQ